jgi:hypothetical protein
MANNRPLFVHRDEGRQLLFRQSTTRAATTVAFEGRIRRGRGLPRAALADGVRAKLQRGKMVLQSRRPVTSKRAVLVSPEFDEGDLHRHCLTRCLDRDDAGNCKGRRSDPQNDFHARTRALLARR